MRVSIEKPGTPEELVIFHISEKPWSDYTEADYTIEQWHSACLIHLHNGPPTSKTQCKLPVKTPNGALNRNGVHAAAAALAGARSPLKASSIQKIQAAAALRRLYSQLDETPPDSLTQSAIDDILEHHGVKGMKWGIRKEEPTSNSSRSSKVSGQGTSLAAFAAVLAAYATFHLIDSGKIHQSRTKNTPIKIDKKLARKNLSIDQLHETVVKPINPNYGDMGTKMNCRRCTFAYEMRRRGLDVKATKSVAATGQSAEGLVEAINPKGSPISKGHQEISNLGKWGEVDIGDKNFHRKNGQEKSNEIFKSLDKLPNRSRGELTVGWVFGGGHSLAWENIKGKTVVFDTQSGKTFKSSSDLAKEFGDHLSEAGYTRLDNADLNMAFLGRWVKNAD